MPKTGFFERILMKRFVFLFLLGGSAFLHGMERESPGARMEEQPAVEKPLSKREKITRGDIAFLEACLTGCRKKNGELEVKRGELLDKLKRREDEFQDMLHAHVLELRDKGFELSKTKKLLYYSWAGAALMVFLTHLWCNWEHESHAKR